MPRGASHAPSARKRYVPLFIDAAHARCEQRGTRRDGALRYMSVMFMRHERDDVIVALMIRHVLLMRYASAMLRRYRVARRYR